MKYRIIKDNSINIELKAEIQTLCPLLSIEKYLKNIKTYEKHREIILPLNSFLIKNMKELENPISKNERAYQIWNNEKMLDDNICKSVIKWNELEELLNYYLTPEPFFDYIHRKKEKVNILMIENKDTWYTLRKLITPMNEECYLFNQEIDVLIYGEGNKGTKPFALEEYEKDIIQRKCNFLYWGDLDYTGIELFERIVKQNPNTSILLFTKIYEKMIEAKDINQLGNIRKKQNKQIEKNIFLQSFSKTYQEKIQEILKQDKYIPQEIINANILKNIIKEGKK